MCCGNVEKHRVFPQFHKTPSVTWVLKIIPASLWAHTKARLQPRITGIKINTHIIGVHTKLRTIPLSHTGIRNNTRIIGVHTKLRTIPLSHTGIRNNTRITLGEAFQNYRSPCHTGIKNNTRIIGEYTKLRTIPLSHAGIKINTRITESTHYDLATLSLPHNTGIENNTRIIGEHTKLRTRPLSHTVIKINTHITLGEAFQNYCSTCHTGIKNNTRTTDSTHYDLATL